MRNWMTEFPCRLAGNWLKASTNTLSVMEKAITFAKNSAVESSRFMPKPVDPIALFDGENAATDVLFLVRAGTVFLVAVANRLLPGQFEVNRMFAGQRRPYRNVPIYVVVTICAVADHIGLIVPPVFEQLPIHIDFVIAIADLVGKLTGSFCEP